MRSLHFMNANQRNMPIAIKGVRYEKGISLGVPGKQVSFRRYLQATEAGLHAHLSATLGEDYGDQLIMEDPEIDMERVGCLVGQTATVFLSSKGEVMHAAPEVVDVVYNPTGDERERRPSEDVPSNVREELPVRWTDRKFDKSEVVRRSLFDERFSFSILTASRMTSSSKWRSNYTKNA